ncbi:MAG TPA: MMPL family transporter [Mycobacteriales bacterium]|jgi:RND superfamily putative drug exporter|nr:MMPL family transporter [Mycobacteriales bacterium]
MGESLPGTPRTVFGRIAEFVLHHRKWVMVGWLLIFIGGGVAASKVSSRLSVDFSLPGQPGYETAKHLTAVYGANGTLGFTSIGVLTPPAGHTAAQETAALDSSAAAIEHAIPGSRVVDYANTHDQQLVGSNHRTTVALIFSPPPTSFASDPTNKITRTLSTSLPGWQTGVTGLDQLSSSGNTHGPGVFAETLIGGAGALIVLAFVFASLLAFLPMLVAAVSILTTFLVVLGLTEITEVSFIVEFLVALVGLGLAIDYSLLVVTRWREEREHGRSNHEAVIRAIETAGRTVAVSGLTVAIGLLALIVLPVPGLRSVGIGGVLIPLISTIVVLTLLPALLGGIGPRADWPRIRHEATASRVWTKWARLVVNRRWIGAGAAVVVLGLFLSPVFGMKVGQTSVAALAQTGPAHTAYVQMTDQDISPGILTPLEILTKSEAAPAVLRAASGASGITTATLPDGPTGSREGFADIIAIPNVVTVNSTTLEPVRSLQAAVNDLPGVIGVGGDGPLQQDYIHAVYGNFPLMFTIIAIATLILLMRAFRSFLLALKAVLLNVVSMAATFGLLTFFWQEGHGSSALFGIQATGAVTFWIPLILFAFLFGLSMDYEVFILSRIREEYDGSPTLGTNGAVVQGLGRTGRLVTSAALILFLAFASLASGPETDIKVLATGLGVGILLDATVVRALLVPALMALMGRWNWWLPDSFARVLRVNRSALAPKAAATTT